MCLVIALGKIMWIIRLFSLALLLPAGASPALAYCSEPSAPSCASRYGSFSDQWEFDRCKRDLESYRSDVEEFMSCNNHEAQNAIDAAKNANESALSGFNEAVSDFNRKASQ